MATYVLVYLIIINIIGLYLMFTDKKRAQKGEYRIKEKTLWKTAIFGGVLGVTIGMKLFRHKTKHAQFSWGLPLLLLVEIGIVYYILERF